MGWSGCINSREVWFSTPTHDYTRTQTKRSKENEHAGSHLLQSRGSLNIREAAYPLLPCVKPFTRLCRESWATRAAAGLQSVSVHGACACLYSVVRVMGKSTHIFFIYQPLHHLKHRGNSALEQKETWCMSSAERRLSWGDYVNIQLLHNLFWSHLWWSNKSTDCVSWHYGLHLVKLVF